MIIFCLKFYGNQSMRVPVIVASEAYKFCEKVQLDSIVYNELGSPLEIICAQTDNGEHTLHIQFFHFGMNWLDLVAVSLFSLYTCAFISDVMMSVYSTMPHNVNLFSSSLSLSQRYVFFFSSSTLFSHVLLLHLIFLASTPSNKRSYPVKQRIEREFYFNTIISSRRISLRISMGIRNIDH